VIPLLVTAYVFATPPQYEAQAAVWVERPTYLVYSTGDINQYLTPAQNQKNRLAELMLTRSFRTDVAGPTSLAQIDARPDGDELLAQIFTRDFDVSATGDHLLVLRFRAEDRVLAGRVLDSLIGAFRSRAVSDRYAQAQVAIAFYQTQATQAESKLASARADLSKYLAANPNIATTLARSGIDAARVDAPFADLQRQVDASQSAADTARTSLDRARFDVSAGAQGDELGFRVTDPTQISTSAARQLKRTIVYPLAALVAGLVLGAGLLMMFALSDHSVRSLTDLAPDMVILGVLPRLKPHGVGRRAGADVIRRGVAFVAGAIMPARRQSGGQR
jgi:uncharacterized protein involved in exopolysaccharide biosynthesis